MVNFDEFTRAFSVELHNNMEGIELTHSPIPFIEHSDYRLISGCNTKGRKGIFSFLNQNISKSLSNSDKLHIGLLVIKGDSLTAAQIKEQLERLYNVKRDKLFPEAFHRLFVLYVFEETCPDEIKNQNLYEKDIIPKEIKNQIFYAGHVDLRDTSAALPPSASPFKTPLKNALEKFKDGINLSAEYEALEEKRKSYESLQSHLSRTKPVATWSLIAICIFMFIWMTLAGGSENIEVLLRFGANYGPLTKSGEWWRLVGSMFLHIGLIHLLVNMYALLVIGSTLEKYFGTQKYLALYAVAGVSGSIVSMIVKSNISAGASGAIFGLCGAAAYIGYKYKNEIPLKLRNQLAGGMVPCIGYNLLYGFTATGIDNAAHIGGLIAGVVYSILIPPPLIKKDEGEKEIPSPLPVFLLIAVILFSVQAYVSYRAIFKNNITDYPIKAYKDTLSGEILFNYPAVMTLHEIEGQKVLAAPGIAIQAASFTDANNINNLKEVQAELIKAFEENGSVIIEKNELIKISDREWLILEGKWPNGTPASIAVTSEGKKLYRMDIYIAEGLVYGSNIKEFIMKNFLPEQSSKNKN